MTTGAPPAEPVPFSCRHTQNVTPKTNSATKTFHVRAANRTAESLLPTGRSSADLSWARRAIRPLAGSMRAHARAAKAGVRAMQRKYSAKPITKAAIMYALERSSSSDE